MPKPYNIPEDAPESVLIDLHREILITNPRVRCHFKWGDFTEYSVKLNQRDVEHIAAREIATTAPFRATVGVDCEEPDAPVSMALEVWDGDEWSPSWDMLNTETLGVAMDTDESGFLQRMNDFIMQKHPAIAALVEIDLQMLRLKGLL